MPLDGEILDAGGLGWFSFLPFLVSFEGDCGFSFKKPKNISFEIPFFIMASGKSKFCL